MAGTVCVTGTAIAIIDPVKGRTVYKRGSVISNSGLAVPAAGHLVVGFDDGVAAYR